jgi:hypothetical protein
MPLDVASGWTEELDVRVVCTYAAIILGVSMVCLRLS